MSRRSLVSAHSTAIALVALTGNFRTLRNALKFAARGLVRPAGRSNGETKHLLRPANTRRPQQPTANGLA